MTTKQDFETLSLASEAQNASVYGGVAAVSPMKRGGKAEFFEANITDGDVQMRVVGFSGGLRRGWLALKTARSR